MPHPLRTTCPAAFAGGDATGGTDHLCSYMPPGVPIAGCVQRFTPHPIATVDTMCARPQYTTRYSKRAYMPERCPSRCAVACVHDFLRREARTRVNCNCRQAPVSSPRHNILPCRTHGIGVRGNSQQRFILTVIALGSPICVTL